MDTSGECDELPEDEEDECHIEKDKRESEKKFIWNKAAIRLLITEYKNRKLSFQNKKCKKKTVWSKIRNKFIESGFPAVRVKDMDKKFRNLRITYLKLKISNETTEYWEYYQDFEDIFNDGTKKNLLVAQFLEETEEKEPTSESEMCQDSIDQIVDLKLSLKSLEESTPSTSREEAGSALACDKKSIDNVPAVPEVQILSDTPEVDTTDENNLQTHATEDDLTENQSVAIIESLSNLDQEEDVDSPNEDLTICNETLQDSSKYSTQDGIEEQEEEEEEEDLTLNDDININPIVPLMEDMTICIGSPEESVLSTPRSDIGATESELEIVKEPENESNNLINENEQESDAVAIASENLDQPVDISDDLKNL